MKARNSIAAILAMALLLVGCGGGSTASTDPTYVVSIMLHGATVDSVATGNLVTKLNTQFPDLATKVDGIGTYIYGDESSPDAITANINKIGMDMSSNKIGIVIASHSNTSGLCASDIFKPIGDIFTPEELATITYPTVKYQKTNVKGAAVGDPIVYGWDVSGSATLKALLGDKTVEIGLVANYPQQNYAKQVLLYLLTQVDKA